jgi:hypothetical protein
MTHGLLMTHDLMMTHVRSSAAIICDQRFEASPAWREDSVVVLANR